MKRRWKETAGFTLVELIVVIAILGTLSAVAVPTYNGYVKKANIASDKQLVSDIENALTMWYYADPSAFPGGAIVTLSAEKPADADDDDWVENAMTAALGEGWEQTAKLKYDGWKSGNIPGSNFKDREMYLLGKVDYLTTNLLEPINAFAGENFQNFMNTNGIDATDKKTVSNAAVLYVANNTANLSKEKQQEVIDIFEGVMTAGGSTNVLGDLAKVYGTEENPDTVSAAAAMYAIAEAYSKHSGHPFEVVFTAEETPETAGSKVNNAFINLAYAGMDDPDDLQNYIESGLVAQDVKAYMDIMSTVNAAKGQVIGNLSSLGKEGGTTWADGYGELFTNYNNGSMFVFLELDKDGVPVTGSTLVEK